MINYYLITSILTLLSFIIIIFTFEPRKSNYYFMIWLLLMALSNGGYLALATSSTLETAVLANKICYLGGCFVPIVALSLACEICNYRIPKHIRIPMYTYSFFVYAMVLTIGYSKLYYTDIYLEKFGNATVLGHSYGIGHIFFYILLYGHLIAEWFILLYSLYKKKPISLKYLSAFILMGVTTIILFILGRFLNPSIEIMPLVYVIDSWIVLYMYRRSTMYSIEDNIINSLRKQDSYGYVMFDKRMNYLGCNKIALNIFPILSNCVVDQPIGTIAGLEDIITWIKIYSTDQIHTFYLDRNDKHYECQMESMLYRKKVSGYVLEIRDDTEKWKYLNLLSKHNSELESFQIKLEKKVHEQTKEILLQQKKINKLFIQTVTALSDAVDAKDRYTSGHSKRVAEYSRMIAIRLGKSKKEQEEIYHAGLLHDIGKIRIPADIINKPGKLTDEEYNIIKIHPVTGYHILRYISENNYIAVGAKYHHERYDGTGYPNGLSGNNIPEVARIIGIADAYDAMASNRSYRNALPQEIVRSEIEKGKGTQFDPHIAEIMLQLIDEDKDYTLKQADSIHKKILTVDDEAMNNKIITHIMHDEPMYEVISACSGKDALELLKQQSFDLILLDVKMPEIDGLETLKLIREKYQTPVVLMTSDKTIDISAGFSEYGCDDYITKPFLPLLVKEIVHNMTERAHMSDY